MSSDNTTSSSPAVEATCSPKRQVIIDTDGDFDDYMAMVYLFCRSDIEVIAIAVTGCGAVHLSKGIENVADMLTLFTDLVPGSLKIPILRGSGAPLLFSNVFPPRIRKPANAHYDAPFPGKNKDAVHVEAQEWLEKFFTQQSTTKVTVLSLGGGTNFGTLFAKAAHDESLNRGIKARLERIVMMGGALKVLGNIEGAFTPQDPSYLNTVAEWNIFVDPRGAQLMFSFGIPYTLVSLDATNLVPIDQPFYDKIKEIDNVRGKFIANVLKAKQDGIGVYLYLWDPLAALALVTPSLITTESYRINVRLELKEEEDTSAQIFKDEEHGFPVDVSMGVPSKHKVYQEYLNTLGWVGT